MVYYIRIKDSVFKIYAIKENIGVFIAFEVEKNFLNKT